ncbi:glycoside hydrolase family 30 protein [Hymenobacter weizhouensis]|uniref:glycoside hydrolase family 30 protein n=1 Tax=Hymenobacter sp. YIM 151500-1 TaxID=2987689 RepID=UPI0022262BEA|nr:glycoside hydrolase family 30 beta sandwich domain-containing protein [Hymenobacter sp. YIM 151500-1]UYZ63113.1 glucosylceramidase [Hymenobacter sp. YIM 151500-1]
MPRRSTLIFSLACLLLGAAGGCSKKNLPAAAPPPPPPPATPAGPSQVALWLTTPDKSSLFRPSPVALNFRAGSSQNPAIAVDTAQTYQTIDGFGYTLTGGSAQLLHQMSAPARAALLQELFGTEGTSIGISYLRISIGASDLDERVFTYDDPPGGQPDPTLAHFSLAPDRAHLLPVLKEILAINPTIKLLGSPWTAPVWMKTNNRSIGGSLRAEYYPVYAQYFVKYLQAMQAEGVRVDAVTLQNEPLHPGNNPSMLMTAAEQATFIRDHVGPALRTAGLTTKIILYDHNLDRPDYPLSILQDPQASQYVDGSAFHLYAGSIETMSTVRNAFPGKHVYFTEQWTGGPGNFAEDFKWHMANLIIGAPRNWSRNVLEWNLAADPNYNPHTPGGCTTCLGALTISGDAVTRNSAYYTVAHAAKFVRPGSVRIGSNGPTTLPHVAYRTPTGQKVLIVLNTGSAPQTFDILFRGKAATTQLPAGAAGTYVW